jgi:murein DD-endopeptidase MepM/ murein hydrolase activator NlpD
MLLNSSRNSLEEMMIGIVAGLGLFTVAAIMIWKRRQAERFFAEGGVLPQPGKHPPGSTWQPTYGEPFTGEAINPANPNQAQYIVASGRLVRGFQPPHMGVDVSAPMGTPVFAAKSGTVTFAGRAPGYGIAVGISHGPNESTWYAHLNSEVATPGMQVHGGQLIGEVGRTSEGPEAITTDWGRRMGTHLHFEVFRSQNPMWQYDNAPRVDPVVWMRQNGIAFFGDRW